MALRIYNTLTGQKEEFRPLDPAGKEVRMYVCGPTVYDEPHIGHLRSAYVFEVIRKWLEYAGYDVRFVRNVTDVDDKIIDKARQGNPPDLKTATADVSSKYFELYKNDLRAMDIQEPTSEPRATAYISKMQELITRLIQKGFAYSVEGSSDVYFEVKKFSSYGKLSKQRIEEMMDQARKESSPGKRDPLDFALWKGAKADEPAWDSPWGMGRPGWHIECSAMNLACLGEQLDIHGGGLDLKFPHHENEIAQSEAATGKTFAKYWIHHGLVTVNGQKMSKSLKNFVTVSNLMTQPFNEFGLRTLKFLFIGTHYSSALDFSEKAMGDALAQSERFLNFFWEAKKYEGTAIASGVWKSFEQRFEAAMNDDFNTPEALAVMHDLMAAARKMGTAEAFVSAASCLRGWGAILTGLFIEVDRLAVLRKSADASTDVVAVIEKRNAARRRKDFATADTIRRELLAQGIEIRDLPDGTTEWWAKA